MLARIHKGNATLRVAHESIFRAWTRLRDWIEKNRATILTRRRVEQAANLWIRNNNDPQLLLPDGRQLEEAEQIKTAPAEEVSAFVLASRGKANRRLRAKRFMNSALIGLLIATIAGASIWGLRESRQKTILASAFDEITQKASELKQANNDITQKAKDLLSANKTIIRSRALSDNRLRELFVSEALRSRAGGSLQKNRLACKRRRKNRPKRQTVAD